MRARNLRFVIKDHGFRYTDKYHFLRNLEHARHDEQFAVQSRIALLLWNRKMVDHHTRYINHSIESGYDHLPGAVY